MSTPVSKQRLIVVPAPKHKATKTLASSGIVIPSDTSLLGPYYLRELNAGANGGNPGSRDNGHDWTHIKVETHRGGSGRFFFVKPVGIYSTFEGNGACEAIASYAETALSLIPGFTGQELVALGASGWASYKPTKPASGLANFLGELKDLPRIPGVLFKDIPKYLQHRTLAFKNLGSEYLNVQFGWLPFVRDIQKLLRSVRSLTPQINQIMRDNGRPIRRSGPVGAAQRSNTVVSYEFNGDGINPLSARFTRPGLDTDYCGANIAGKHGRFTTSGEEVRVWFSGRFRYFLSRNPVIRNIQIADRLFGILPTPKLVWDLMPWSWLIDWFANVGDNIDNLSDLASGLVADYAYVMAQKVTTKETVAYSTLWNGSVLHARSKTVTTSQQRAHAGPFGFGLNPSSFTARQVAILAALGITRVR